MAPARMRSDLDAALPISEVACALLDRRPRAVAHGQWTWAAERDRS